MMSFCSERIDSGQKTVFDLVEAENDSGAKAHTQKINEVDVSPVSAEEGLCPGLEDSFIKSVEIAAALLITE